MIKVYKKSEVARKIGVTPQALTPKRLKKIFKYVVYVKKAKHKGRGSLTYCVEDEKSFKVLRFFYSISLEHYMSFTTFRDLFNELVGRKYDLVKFIMDYDENTVLTLLGYDCLEKYDGERYLFFARKLYTALVYAFSIYDCYEAVPLEVV